MFVESVRIIMSDDDDAFANDALVYFDGTVKLGTRFRTTAENAGESRYKANSYMHLLDMNDNVLQTVGFHTSCSQPLRVGDRFASIVLGGFRPEE